MNIVGGLCIDRIVHNMFTSALNNHDIVESSYVCITCIMDPFYS